jgi:hypothetical protein
MFGISLGGYNFNKNNRIFDVMAYQLICKNGCHNYNILPVELEPCSRAHWSFVPEVDSRYEKL